MAVEVLFFFPATELSCRTDQVHFERAGVTGERLSRRYWEYCRLWVPLWGALHIFVPVCCLNTARQVLSSKWTSSKTKDNYPSSVSWKISLSEQRKPRLRFKYSSITDYRALTWKPTLQCPVLFSLKLRRLPTDWKPTTILVNFRMRKSGRQISFTKSLRWGTR
jgi:hypothetical protein